MSNLSDLVTAIGTVCTFLFTQLTAFVSWFTGNLIGQIIIGLMVFAFIIYLGVFIIQKIKG